MYKRQVYGYFKDFDKSTYYPGITVLKYFGENCKCTELNRNYVRNTWKLIKKKFCLNSGLELFSLPSYVYKHILTATDVAKYF